MNRFLKLSLPAVAGLLVSAVAPHARAESASTNFTVTATVKRTCLIGAAAITLTDYDAVAGTGGTGTGSVTVQCTKNLPYTIKLNRGANAGTDSTVTNRFMLNGTETLRYELKDSSNALIGETAFVDTKSAGKAETAYTISAAIAAGQDPSIGTYVDTVSATVEF
jgi:spore coat protein U-like protein